MKKTKAIFLIGIFCLCFQVWGAVEDYRMNQLGYYPAAKKVAVLVGASDSLFEILNPDNEVVLAGELSEQIVWSETNDTIKQADFSELTEPGTYWIRTESLGKSFPFRISTRVYAKAARASLKSFYFQRASMELEEEYAGVYARAAGHPDTAVAFHPSSGKDSGKASSPGGWYDAGDYGKYIVNAGITVGTMLQFYELFGDYFGDTLMNIPESQNGLDDLLDEVRYEIEWMKTMQDTDGGVFHKLTTLNFTGTVMPHRATATRYFIGKATPATLDFAAVMAMAARIYEPLDSSFAASCLTQAEDAWGWAVENPDSFFVNPDTVNGLAQVETGEYGDNSDRDEEAWAATELFITTGKDEYREVVTERTRRYRSIPAWQNVMSLSPLSLAIVQNDLDSANLAIATNSIIEESESFLDDIESHPFRIPVFGYYWGSNSVIANQAIALITAYTLTEDDRFIKGAAECVDYLLGKNATTYSFLTGFGIKASNNPHHRPSGADNIEQTIPGFLVGGPNGGPDDYIDDYGSFTTNEVAINWSSPMTFILAAVDQVLGEGPEIDENHFAIVVSTLGPGNVQLDPEQTLYEKGTTVTLTAIPDSGEIFRGWAGALKSDDTTITLTIDKDLLISARFGLADELVRNGDFSSGVDEWNVTNHEGGDGGGSVSDGAFVLNISEGGDENWSIQMSQLGLELIEGGIYTFSFDAWADSARTMISDVAMSKSPYSSYMGDQPTEISLTTESQKFTFEFTMNHPTDEEARITFNAGLSNQNVYIDNVSVKMTGMTPIRHSAVRKSAAALFHAESIGSSIRLKLTVNNPAASKLRIYSVAGRMVRDLSSHIQSLEKGAHTLRFHNNLGSGMYVLRFKDGSREFSQPLSIMGKN